MAIDGWMDEQNVANTYNGISFNLTKQRKFQDTQKHGGGGALTTLCYMKQARHKETNAEGYVM